MIEVENDFNIKTKGISPENLIDGEKLVEIHKRMSSNAIGIDASDCKSEVLEDDDVSIDEVDQHSLWDKVKLILSNKAWVLICAAITLLYYLVTGI